MRRDYAVQAPLALGRQWLRLNYAAPYAVQIGAGKQFDQGRVIVIVIVVVVVVVVPVVPLKQMPHAPISQDERVAGFGFCYRVREGQQRFRVYLYEKWIGLFFLPTRIVIFNYPYLTIIQLCLCYVHVYAHVCECPCL